MNTHLLDKIAEENRGSRQYVSPKESIEVKVSAFVDKIASPVLTDLAFEVDGVWIKDVYPKRIPDLFRGEQLVLLGRHKGEGSHAVRLKGTFGGERKEFVYDGSFPVRSTQAALPRLWAMRKVAYLLDQIRLHGESKEVKDEVVRLAKKYGVITPYTSYLVLEEGELAAGRRGAPAPERAFRDRVRRLGGGAADRVAGAPEEMRREKGRAAPELSKKIGRLLGGQTLDDAEEEDFGDEMGGRNFVRHVGEKTFYLDGTVWVDSAASPEREAKRIPYLSDEYFQLLKDVPGIGVYLALGPSVRVLLGETLYEIQ